MRRAVRLIATILCPFVAIGCSTEPARSPGGQTAIHTTAAPTIAEVEPSHEVSSRTNCPVPRAARDVDRLPLQQLAKHLTRAGMTSVAEAEPPHGSPIRILYGQFHGREVVASAGRPGSGLDAGRVGVRRFRINGVTVREVVDCSGGSHSLTFTNQRVRWLLGYLEQPTTTGRLRELIAAMLAA